MKGRERIGVVGLSEGENRVESKPLFVLDNVVRKWLL